MVAAGWKGESYDFSHWEGRKFWGIDNSNLATNENIFSLKGKWIEREKGIAVRQSLMKALQQSKENGRMHGHAYSTYTNCIYKILFGMNAKQLREKFGISKKENLRDCFSEEELKFIQSMENLVSGLVDCGWDYDKVKAFIENTNTKHLQIA